MKNGLSCEKGRCPHRYFHTALLVILIVILTVGIPNVWINSTSAVEPRTWTIGTWTESSENPIFAGKDRAYYPCVLHIGGTYHMWYTDEDYQTGYTISGNGITWDSPTIVTGLGGNPVHAVVVNVGTETEPYYRIWYANKLVWPDNVDVIRTVESADGINWTNDQPIGQINNVIQENNASKPTYKWMYGSYGPEAVLYNPDGYQTLNETDPMGNKYVMYYDGYARTGLTEGINEFPMLAISVDGINWKRVTDEPLILPSGGTTEWDANYISIWSVLKRDDGYHLWYSGGISDRNDGIGYATSADGLNWTKCPENPLLSVADKVEWRDDRTYCPCVLEDDGVFKMWFAGKDTKTESYTVGYATISSPLPDFFGIQYAIDTVDPGDVLVVSAGTYNESINIDKSLTVVSASGAPSTVIDAQGADFGVLVEGVGTVATIDGFTVRNYEVGGIVAGTFSLSADDPAEVHILNNIVEEPLPEDSHNNCIQVGDGTTGTITGNEVSGAYLISEDWSGSGILVVGSNDVLVANNYVHTCEGGIQIVGYAEYRNAPAINNIIENNKVEGCETGISIQMYSSNTVVRYNNVSNNDEGISVMAIDYSKPSHSWEEHSTPSGTEIHYNNIIDNIVGVVSSIWGNDTGTVPTETVNATLNWWGTTDPDLIAASTTGSVVFDPCLTPAHPDTLILNEKSGFYYQTIQSAIDAASDYDTINVPAGVYNERITIEKPLTLRGATADTNKNGYTVPTNYAWDSNVETILNNPEPELEGTVVYIHDTDDVTFEGFIVQKLNAVSGRNVENVLTIKADTMTMQNIIIRNNIIGPNTNSTHQDGNSGRMGLYISVHAREGEIPYGLVDSTISGNKIFDCKGNGDSIFIWGAYYSSGARYPSPMEGTVIEDNEITGSHRTGIEIAGGCSGLTIRNNIISNNKGLPTDDPILKYGSGIVLIRGSSDSESSTGLGPESLTIVGNDIFGNEKNGIYMGPVSKNHNITGNNIHDNGWDGIRLDMEAHYHNPDFETVDRTALFNATENITATYNNIYDNSELGVNVVGNATNGFVLNATLNWWGAASGPDDKISERVVVVPWIHDAYGLSMEEIVEPEGERYGSAPKLSNFGFGAAIHNLKSGWYRLDSGTWNVLFADVNVPEWNSDNWQVPDFAGLAEGTHTVFFKVDDVFGHESDVWSWRFYKDKASPTISNSQVNPDSGTPGTKFTITTDVEDPAGIQSVRASIQKPDETEVASVELMSGSSYSGIWDSTGVSEGTYYVDIIATDKAGNSIEKENAVHFPVLAMPVINWTCCCVPANQTNYEFDAKNKTGASVFLDTSTGTPTVTVACCNPENTTGFSCDVNKYIDVQLDDPTCVTSLEIKIYYTQTEVEGLVEADLRLYWWNGAAWEMCLNTGVNTTDCDCYSGYIWAKITADTEPSLSDLTGTPFGANSIEHPVGGTFGHTSNVHLLEKLTGRFLVEHWLIVIAFGMMMLGVSLIVYQRKQNSPSF